MLVQKIAPENDVISVEDMKAHLRVDSADFDTEIGACVLAATQRLDGGGGILGRCLITQTWQLRLNGFPAEIALPLTPCQSVTSITYIDNAGQLQTLAPDSYQLFGAKDPSAARIAPAFGRSWPSARAASEAVTVVFIAGYGDEPEYVPEPIRTAIKMHAAFLFENRESVAIGSFSALELPQGAAELLANYRNWGF